MKLQNGLPISLFRRTILFLAFVLLNISFASAQGNKDIEIYFENDSIAVERGSTFSNILVVENKSQSEITIQNIVPEEKYPGLLLYPKNGFTLGARESKKLPLKLIANLDFMKMKSNKIGFNISYSTLVNTNTENASFSVARDENKNIAIYTAGYENFINPAVPESSILLFVENQSFSQRTLKIDLQSIPDGLEMTPKQPTITLEGLEKQSVEIRIAVRRQNALFPEFSIQATANDVSTNEILGSNTIHLLILTNNRQISRGSGTSNGSNFAEVGYNENSSGFNFLQLRGNKEFRMSDKLSGRINLGADYYLEDALYNIYDTWLEVERKNTVLRLGNVNGGDYDYPVFGRGGKISTKFGEQNELEILALDSNYNLYSTYFLQGQGSTMGGAKYTFTKSKSFNGKISYVFDHDPRVNVDTQVANATTSISIQDKHHIRTELGLSHEKGLVNNDENAGASFGIDYSANLGSWNIQSMNSYSTKSYAGLKRGSFYINQRIGREFSGSQRIFLQYQNSQINPEYLSYQNTSDSYANGDDTRYYFNSTQALGLGYQFSAKNWNFLFVPKIENQKTANFYDSQELFSYRLESNISTTIGAHGLNWTAEYSYSKQDGKDDWFNSLRTTLSYRYKSFSLNGTAQWNAINVFDLNTIYDVDRDFANYNGYASYNFNLLSGNLIGSFSAGVSYSELYQNLNSIVSGNLEYKISPSWSTTGYFNFSGYESRGAYSNSGSFYQYRIGVKKYFATATAIGNHKVTLQLFEDKNFNGLLEEGEKVLANEIIKLDNFVALTDKNGKVVFQNVPEGVYTLKVNESTGSRLMMDPAIMVTANINKKIGLVKNIRVAGKLKEIKQAYDEVETDVTGTVVYARSEDGVVTTAVVNQKNEFEFFLKDGKYELYIENDRYSYTQPTQTIEVKKEDYKELVIFEYKKKDTTIKVKKF